jgi:hypothetical protein
MKLSNTLSTEKEDVIEVISVVKFKSLSISIFLYYISSLAILNNFL